jgi:hypothetical protein
VLEAAYEATLLAGSRTADRRVFLTLLGGGVFGNRMEWIVDAMQYAIARTRDLGLDIRIVSYRYSNPALAACFRDGTIQPGPSRNEGNRRLLRANALAACQPKFSEL